MSYDRAWRLVREADTSAWGWIARIGEGTGVGVCTAEVMARVRARAQAEGLPVTGRWIDDQWLREERPLATNEQVAKVAAEAYEEARMSPGGPETPKRLSDFGRKALRADVIRARREELDQVPLAELARRFT
jgi:hypothetical protein